MDSTNQDQSDVLESAADSESSRVSSSTDFCLRLLRQCRSEGEEGEGENVVMAPYSLATALAAVSMGARGTTAQQIKQALHWSTDTIPEDLDIYVSALRNSSNKEVKKKKKSTPFGTLKAALGIFVARSCPLKPDFISNAQEIFASGIMPADFQNNPETEAENINRWVAEHTLGNIRDLLPENSISASTSMVLAIGTFTKETWKHKFNVRKTKQEEFYGPGEPVKVWMMKQTNTFPYGDYMGRPVVLLPFVPSPPKELPAMLVVLSNGDPSDVDFLEESLTPTKRTKLLDSLTPTKVEVKLPRFTAESWFSLTKGLETQGITEAFGDSADFSGMVETGQPVISEVFQKTVIQVDEEGAEASAEASTSPFANLFFWRKKKVEETQKQSFTANIPFLYFVVNTSADSPGIWTTGRVVNPN